MQIGFKLRLISDAMHTLKAVSIIFAEACHRQIKFADRQTVILAFFSCLKKAFGDEVQILKFRERKRIQSQSAKVLDG